jgi:DNA-binding NtrC family response regulator
VRQKTFREDFYYRINVFTIEVPPLRARPTDIPVLAEHFRQRFAGQMDKRITAIGPDAMELLVAHHWPGNVRELSNAIERAMVVGKPPAIRPRDLPLHQRAASAGPADSLSAVEQRHIADVLDRTEWNITQAAELLGVNRVTVYNKIRKYGLQR